MSDFKVEEFILSVQDSYKQLMFMLEGTLAELETPKLYKAPAENEWSVMQIMAHIIEFMPYWGSEVKKLVALPGQKFGRTMEDENRIQAVAEHGNDTLEQAREAMPGSYDALIVVLQNLKDSDLDLTGIHPRFGEKPLGWFINEFVAVHLKNHIKQINETLQAV